jgi:small subunit ribosomal protein S13
MRISGVNIPDDKKIKVALTYIFGIGSSLAEEILDKVKIDKERRTKDLSAKESNVIQKIIEDEYKIEGELHQDIKQNINRLKNISSYRGERHSKKMPARGQRTKTNSRTVRGNTKIQLK